MPTPSRAPSEASDASRADSRTGARRPRGRAPPPISSTARLSFRGNNVNPFTNGSVLSGLDLVLTVNTGINATNPIWGIAEAFGRNSIGTQITDQSDNSAGHVANKV